MSKKWIIEVDETCDTEYQASMLQGELQHEGIFARVVRKGCNVKAYRRICRQSNEIK
jgi:hypothetical protein